MENNITVTKLNIGYMGNFVNTISQYAMLYCISKKFNMQIILPDNRSTMQHGCLNMYTNK